MREIEAIIDFPFHLVFRLLERIFNITHSEVFHLIDCVLETSQDNLEIIVLLFDFFHLIDEFGMKLCVSDNCFQAVLNGSNIVRCCILSESIRRYCSNHFYWLMRRLIQFFFSNLA
jgi:hypothetical protein